MLRKVIHGIRRAESQTIFSKYSIERELALVENKRKIEERRESNGPGVYVFGAPVAKE